ncbi:putative lysophospholipase [Mycena rebaudengoi]|nr:putative lysophospholipase [Mycena rebaudengoi]
MTVLSIFLYSFLSILSVAGSADALEEASRPKAFNWDSIRYMHAFGDSYTFVQGTAGVPGFDFIGDAQNFAFTPRQLLTDRIVPGNTSSEGANWIEFLTGCMGGLPSLCSTQLWNFAFAGAGIDAALLPLHRNITIPLVDQVTQWQTYASKFIPHPPGETLTAWWIGINDAGDSTLNASITDFPAFWDTEMTSMFRGVQKAQDNGLEAHLFINVPPVERAPRNIGNTTRVPALNTNILQCNDALSNHIAKFKARNPAATVITFDAHAWFNKVLDSPLKFGFNNITGFCECEESAGFFWHNTLHPTERVHRLLAGAIETQLRQLSSHPW